MAGFLWALDLGKGFLDFMWRSRGLFLVELEALVFWTGFGIGQSKGSGFGFSGVIGRERELTEG